MNLNENGAIHPRVFTEVMSNGWTLDAADGRWKQPNTDKHRWLAHGEDGTNPKSTLNVQRLHFDPYKSENGVSWALAESQKAQWGGRSGGKVQPPPPAIADTSKRNTAGQHQVPSRGSPTGIDPVHPNDPKVEMTSTDGKLKRFAKNVDLPKSFGAWA